MACLKKERKPMVPLKTLDIIFRRRYVPNTQHYFTNRKQSGSGEEDETKKKPSKPFRVPRSEKLLSYIKYSDRKEKVTKRETLQLPLILKGSLKTAAVRDMSKRLFIEEPIDDVRAVVEIHPEFYTVIEGRPLRSFDDIKVYLNNIRAYAMNRQQIGYRRDLILKIDKSMSEEIDQFNIIYRDVKQHIKNFQKFLTEDYKKACIKVAKAEKLYAELNAKNLEYLGYVSSLTLLNNNFFKLDAIRSVLKAYRTYLMFAAPLQWRQQNDETLKNRVQSIQFESGEYATDNDLVETMDIDQNVQRAKMEFQNPLPALLYFKEPEQMIYLFRTLELQSREYLIQLSKTHAPYKLLLDRIKELKHIAKQEFDYYRYYIDRIDAEIERETYNEKYFQDKFFRILNESFCESIASPSVLKFKICLEYVYEQIFGKCEEGHHSLQNTLKILEVMYEDVNLELDAMDFKIVNKARKELFAQDLRMMSNAYKAQRELRSFREMTNAMNKAFYPPAKYARPVLKKFVDKKKLRAQREAERLRLEEEARKAGSAKNIKLTPEEREGLTLFTNWCDGMNPTPFLRDYYEFVKPVFEWNPRRSLMN